MSSHQQQLYKTRTSTVSVRVISLSILTAYLLHSTFWPNIRQYVLPHGPAQPTRKFTYAAIDKSNTLLQIQHGRSKKIVMNTDNDDKPSLISAIESIITRPNSKVVYGVNSYNQLVKITIPDEVNDFGDESSPDTIQLSPDNVKLVTTIGNGRVLGGAFTADGRDLYLADAVQGLFKVTNIDSNRPVVELINTRVKTNDSESDIAPLLYADDVVVGSKSGLVYVTDATAVYPDRLDATTFDTWYASKVDIIRGSGTGRVLEYNPETGTTRVVADGLRFANGISTLMLENKQGKKEEALIVVETAYPRVVIIFPSTGEQETLLDDSDLTGYPDGLECESNLCFVGVPVPINPIHKFCNMLPSFISVPLRTFLLMIPRDLAPKAQAYGAIVSVTVNAKANDNKRAENIEYLQDPTGKDFSSLISATRGPHGKLYFGDLHHDFIGVYDMSTK